MNVDQELNFRLAVLSTLVHKTPHRPGRTVLMKYAYLLQTIRDVPLGYRFELYNYGPYDSTVLGDLSQAIALKALKSDTVYYSTGFGYEYATTEKGFPQLSKRAAADIEQYSEDIEWVIREFGDDSASRLELVSTIVYAEREMHRKRKAVCANDLCEQVKRIKPHFTESVILDTIHELSQKNLIVISA